MLLLRGMAREIPWWVCTTVVICVRRACVRAKPLHSGMRVVVLGPLRPVFAKLMDNDR